jgi:hypothetical protein
MIYDVLTKRFNTKHWDDSIEIPQQTIDYITDCLLKSPYKMAMIGYKIAFITNTENGRDIKNWLFYDHTWNSNGVRAGRHTAEEVENNGRRDYNGQYQAPLLIAWLNPKDSHKFGEMNGQQVVFPNFTDRQNNIFISNTIAMLAAEESGLNTGFGSCHDHDEVALRLGFAGYSCPIVLGVGYAKDMSKDIENMNIFLPVSDPSNISESLGTCFVNLPAHYPKPIRTMRPSKEELIIKI